MVARVLSAYQFDASIVFFSSSQLQDNLKSNTTVHFSKIYLLNTVESAIEMTFKVYWTVISPIIERTYNKENF